MANGETLEAKLAPMRQAGQERMPAPLLETQRQLVAELERTLVATALDVGETAPNFTLPTAGNGETVRLSEAVQGGPVVLSFYRGQW